MKIYAVIADSCLGGEEINSVWHHKKNAETRLRSINGYRIEEHTVDDFVLRERDA